jgi:uncharacterized protein (DUF305 family)
VLQQAHQGAVAALDIANQVSRHFSIRKILNAIGHSVTDGIDLMALETHRG